MTRHFYRVVLIFNHLVAVLPQVPDHDGRISKPPNLIGRDRAISTLREVAPGRVAIYRLESPTGVPVYVHAKVCTIDDQWAALGSDNFNRRSWTHDSELSPSAQLPGLRWGCSCVRACSPTEPSPRRSRRTTNS